MTVILLLETCRSRCCDGEAVRNASIAAITDLEARCVATAAPMPNGSNAGITAIDCIAGDGVEC